MDPLSIIVSSLTPISAVAATYDSVKTISDLPKAFDKVHEDVPPLEIILRKAVAKVNDSILTDDEQQAIVAIAKPC